MITIVPNQEFIEKNYNKTIELVEKFKLKELQKLLESYSEEYATAPASTDAKYYCAFPGGLCYHNLHVLQWLGRFSGAMTNNSSQENFDKSSMLKVSILHDFAKVGEENQPFYLCANEQWKIDRGVYFEINPKLNYFRIPQKSLYMAQKHNIPLSQEEYLAILLADGHLDDVNAPYKYKEPKLALALHFAVYWARTIAKEFEVVYP